MPNKYYSLEKSNNEADLYIFGDITSYPWDEKDKDAYGIVKELGALEADTINVHINSYGGDVSEGLAIHNVLKNSKSKVKTYCDGFACSAASVIFMAGDERIMNSASLLMIHNAWSWGCGNAAEFRKQADDLDKITQASINAYMARVTIPEETVKQLMDDESWLTPEECLEYGFATSVLENENETGVNQSAFNMIKERLMSKEAVLDNTEDHNLIVQMNENIKALTEKIETMKPKEHEEVKHGFNAFFNA